MSNIAIPRVMNAEVGIFTRLLDDLFSEKRSRRADQDLWPVPTNRSNSYERVWRGSAVGSFPVQLLQRFERRPVTLTK